MRRRKPSIFEQKQNRRKSEEVADYLMETLGEYLEDHQKRVSKQHKQEADYLPLGMRK